MHKYLLQCRQHFIYTGVFSFFVNILTLTVSIYMLQVFDRVFSSRSQETLLMLTIVAIGALLVMMALDILRSRLLLAAGVTLDTALGPKVLASLLGNVSRGSQANAGNLKDVATVRGFLTGQGVIALFDAPWLPFYVFVIYLFHPILGVAATIAAVLLILLAWLNERLTRSSLEQAISQSQSAAKLIDSGVRNAEVLSALGMLPTFTNRWKTMNEYVMGSQMDAGRRSALIVGVTKFFRMAIQVIMMGLGAWLVIHQDLSSGGMIATTIILGRALQPVEAAITTWRSFVNARVSYQKLEAMLKGDIENTSALELPIPRGDLSVERVVVQLRAGARQLLAGVTFELAAGESLGVIGPSAAGKSTLARVLTAVWKPIIGTVRLDGAELFTWDKTQLGSHIGYLPQDVELFEGTVAENIARLGKVESNDIIIAAKRAFAHDLILQLPNGYETDVGEGAVNLSVGQRQRIGLARALFGHPKLVVLDEPNASLDGEGELALMQSLKGLKDDGVTVVIISHKPSVLSQVDKMLVLRDGRAELFGTRQDVLAKLTKATVVNQPVTNSQIN